MSSENTSSTYNFPGTIKVQLTEDSEPVTYYHQPCPDDLCCQNPDDCGCYGERPNLESLCLNPTSKEKTVSDPVSGFDSSSGSSVNYWIPDGAHPVSMKELYGDEKYKQSLGLGDEAESLENDLSAWESKLAVEILNDLLSSMFVFSHNVLNLHWNLSGSLHFVSAHEFLGDLYEGLNEEIDAIGEAIRKEGETPRFGLEEHAKKSRVGPFEFGDPVVNESLEKAFECLSIQNRHLLGLVEGLQDADAMHVQVLADDLTEKHQTLQYFLESSVRTF